MVFANINLNTTLQAQLIRFMNESLKEKKQDTIYSTLQPIKMKGSSSSAKLVLNELMSYIKTTLYLEYFFLEICHLMTPLTLLS